MLGVETLSKADADLGNAIYLNQTTWNYMKGLKDEKLFSKDELAIILKELERAETAMKVAKLRLYNRLYALKDHGERHYQVNGNDLIATLQAIEELQPDEE